MGFIPPTPPPFELQIRRWRQARQQPKLQPRASFLNPYTKHIHFDHTPKNKTMADNEGCVAICCGSIGTCFAVILQDWCNICKTGQNTTKRQAGCCPQSFGGTNDDDFDDAERKDLASKKVAASAGMKQPGPVVPMSVPLGAPTTNNTTTATTATTTPTAVP